VTIRVFLLDDHEVVRRGVRDMLRVEADLTVVGEAATADEALEMIGATTPDVAVLDVRLGEEAGERSGIEACREIRSTHPNIACIMLTSYADDEALMASILAGAAGYVLKQVRGTDLADGIRRVARGETLLDPTLTTHVLDRLRAAPSDEDALIAGLSERERTVLDYIAQGYTNRRIAESMFLAEKTIKNYVSKLLANLGMSRRTEAAAYAARLQERRSLNRNRSNSD